MSDDSTAPGSASKPELPPPPGEPLAPIDFAGMILSFATSVLINLGVAEDPVTGESRLDLAGAHQTIDMLEMIQRKTAGNLTPEEEHLLDKLVFDLKMAYVNAHRQHGA